MTMTVAEGEVQPKKDQAKSGPYRELQSGPVEISRIEVRGQHRKLFNERAMKELTDNVRHVGILEPILLRYREGGKNGYILIAGERRLRAAKGAGLQQIPARVLDVNEAQAAEIQALENLHREGLGEIEQARAFKTLLDAEKYDVAGLAARMDKSKTYVYRAIALLDLAENVIAAIEDGRLTPAHGHQILRVPVSERGKVSARALTKDYDDELLTAVELRDWVDRELGQSLTSAVFPTGKPFAGEVACTACPYNTGNQGMLFDGAEKGGCTNSGCFEKKTAAHWQLKVEEVQKKHGPEQVLLYEHNIWDGQTYKGVVIKKVMPSGHHCKLGQAAVISKMGGTVWLAEKPKPNPKQAAAAASQAKRDPRQDAIDNRVDELLREEELRVIAEANEEDLAVYLAKQWSSSWMNGTFKKFGINLKKPKMADMLRGAFLWHRESESPDTCEVIEELAPDNSGKAIIAAAKKKAAAEYDAKNHTKKESK